ncbi:hypothetical protein C8F01DRAFT_1227663 [Mycena amicta]|nr:hypothetical protein C8F01DRAFT_1227663 [Mycena amicta]
MPEVTYTLLSDSEEAKLLREAQSVQFQSVDEPSRRRQGRLKLLLVVSMLFNIGFACLYFGWSYRASRTSGRTPMLYSPAQSAIEYKLVKFHKGINNDRMGDVPLYEQAPSDEGDEAWEALYANPDIRIPKSEAVKLHNATWPIENDPGQYTISLEMFHQLHCLDKIRQQLYPERGYQILPQDHIRHCIGVVRQALMCYGDVTPVVFQWSDLFKQAVQRDDIVHECRDHDKIRAWADAHRGKEPPPDLSVYVEQELN